MEKFIFISYCVLHGIAFLIIGYIAIDLYKSKNRHKNKHKNESRNKVHFYVARDKDGDLWIYLGKPFRCNTMFSSPLSHLFAMPCGVFNYLGLNKKDYDNLKWEDEPVEVFLNLDD